MKYLVIPVILFLIIGCSNPKEVNSNAKKEKRFETLLSKYKYVKADTLRVHYISGDEEKSKFYGVLLDSLERRLLPYGLNDYTEYYAFFACFKFDIDSTRIGLITRSPSNYESSSVKVLVYNTSLDSITYYFELADDWGDAGASFQKTSWLYKSNNSYKVFTVCSDIYDHAIESEGKDTTVDYNISSYMLAIDKYHLDTIVRNDTNLLKRFKHKL